MAETPTSTPFWLRFSLMAIVCAALLTPFMCPTYNSLWSLFSGSNECVTCSSAQTAIPSVDPPMQVKSAGQTRFQKPDQEAAEQPINFQNLLSVRAHQDPKSIGLLEIDRLPMRMHDVSSYQFSSEDTQLGRDDFGNYISIDNTKLRIFEAYGHGAIRRSFFLYTPQSDGVLLQHWRIIIEVDGVEVQKLSIKSMSSGIRRPYISPIAGSNVISSGYWNYAPIYFREKCIISLEYKKNQYRPSDDPRTARQALVYQISYMKFHFSPPPHLHTYQGLHDNDTRVLEKLLRSNLGPVPPKLSVLPTAKEIKGDVTATAGAETNVINFAGAGSITAVRMKFHDTTQDLFKSIVLSMYWDGSLTPQVQCPLYLFFGVRSALNGTRSLVSGYHPVHGGYFYLPMPFWANAKITLTTPPNHQLRVSYVIDISSIQYPKQETGYFTVTTNKQLDHNGMKMFHFLKDDAHWGHIVSLSVHSDRHQQLPMTLPWVYDDVAFIDSSHTENIRGTSFESLFNNGYELRVLYNFSSTFHGIPSIYYENPLVFDVDAYRHFIQDPIVYHNRITYGIEPTRATVNYEVAVFSYRGVQSGLSRSDVLDVGDGDSELQHSYKCDTCDDVTLKNVAFISNPQRTLKEITGKIVRGSCTFTVKISANNRGVLIRRTFNFKYRHQRAKVIESKTKSSGK
eukprot:TRINITY_DN1144_c0_g2_i1.p1 TRINITY_DN1144_c0_g2~~TRINITY_DN1144_c0_g2_i1.p1  ORF type:complete len:680 (+),score=95.60 TRINITY_DN1144_c0_g2_i1:75-2114(+)